MLKGLSSSNFRLKMPELEADPMASRVKVQAMPATEAADGKLLAFHDRICLKPAIADATPTTPASIANVTKNPVAIFPMGK